MNTNNKLSECFPFCYSLIKCYYSNEGLYMKDYEFIIDSSVNDVSYSEGCLLIPNNSVEQNNIKLLNYLIAKAKEYKADIDTKEMNNFYAFSIGLSNYVYGSSYYNNIDSIDVKSDINLVTCFLPSNIYHNLISPLYEYPEFEKQEVNYVKDLFCDVSNDFRINILNMHGPIGDFCVLDRMMNSSNLNTKSVYSKLISDSKFYSILSSYIKDYYQDDFSYSLFMFMVCMKYDINLNLDYSILYEDSNIKTANKFWESPFWIFGLIEKMLEPARGFDYTVKKTWDPYVKHVYGLIEKSRKDNKLSGATMEFMLRAIGPNNENKPELIEKILEDMRYE